MLFEETEQFDLKTLYTILSMDDTFTACMSLRWLGLRLHLQQDLNLNPFILLEAWFTTPSPTCLLLLFIVVITRCQRLYLKRNKLKKIIKKTGAIDSCIFLCKSSCMLLFAGLSAYIWLLRADGILMCM